jgi:hypothetical protein
MLDTTLRPIVFGLDKNVTPEAAKAVGPEKFKKYEHALNICAQLSRIVYCDSGIGWHVLKETLGQSTDMVNNAITKYDKQFRSQRFAKITSQPGEPGTDRPAESYSLQPGDGTNPWGIYIGSPKDCTILLTKSSILKANPNSIFTPSDIFVSFKGSSTMKNFKHDLYSQFTSGELRSIASQYMMNDVGNIPKAFAKPFLKIFSQLIKAIETLSAGATDVRLFLTGHSLGGTQTTLFGFILAEAKLANTIPLLSKVKSIHIVSFGAATCLSDKARNSFNKHLDSGLITIDRVAEPGDPIQMLPAGFSHPGFRPLKTELFSKPEANGRPYQLKNIRTFYGAPSTTNRRDLTTWPFGEMTQPTPQEVPDVGIQAATEGGGIFESQNKGIYAAATKTHIPNLVNVSGSLWAKHFPHAEYMGMFYFGGLRLPGLKNPATKSLAYFLLNDTGVKITYLPTEERAEPGQEGAGRKSRKHRNGRKQRKTRKN